MEDFTDGCFFELSQQGIAHVLAWSGHWKSTEERAGSVRNVAYTRDIVLIADDDPDICQAMRTALQEDGFEIVEVSDGKEAVAAFSEHQPSLVLLEVELPVQDGFSACAEIRGLPNGVHVPIVMVTGREDLQAVNQAFGAGATDFIAKPINWSIFTHRIRYVRRAGIHFNELRRSEQKNEALLSAVPDTLFSLSLEGRILEFRPGSSTHPLPDPEDNTVQLVDYFPRPIAERWLSLNESVQKEGIARQCEFSLQYENETAHYEVRFVPYLEGQVLAIVTEFTERKRAQERIRRLAFYDTLTGLPNRQFFMMHVDRMIQIARDTDVQIAVLYIDLDNFKRINDNLGHSYGDGVLRAIAERLSGCVRREGPATDGSDDPVGIARLGGDEFVCALEYSEEGVLTAVAERIQDQLRQSVEFRGHEFVVTPSVGIATFPHDSDNAEDLLKFADVAMYQAKGAGRNAVRHYSGTMSLRSMHRLELEGGLRHALEHDELELYYQPKRDLHTGKTVGVEALLRWKDEAGDFISPGLFIPMAEETGLIVPLGEWVLRTACRQIKHWQNSLGADVNVAVNISSQQFYQSDLKKTVMKALFEASIRPTLLQLELTESLLMQDVSETIDTLNYLKNSGVGLAIDDFGTGYSSLSYLRRFPLDALKIDRSFVAELQDNNDDAAICAAIIAMAHRLGLEVIAEGIETDHQLQFLRDQGCEQGQGFLLGRPLPAEEFERAVNARPNQLLVSSGTAPQGRT